VVKGQVHPSRSNIWVKIADFHVHFCNIEDSNLIFGMHVYLMELHILSGKRLRSRSSFKVKGQIYGDIVFHKHIACFLLSIIFII